MAIPNKLAKAGIKGVLAVLNDTSSVREAARRLNVSPQTLYHFMPGRIARHCVYIDVAQREFIAKIIMPSVVDVEGDRQ